MNKIIKRGKGKHSNSLGIKHIYKFYTENYKDAVDYETFTKIVKSFNKELVSAITKESAIIQLPYRLGELQVSKFERSFDQPMNKWKVDWKKTREMGFKVYHDQKYIYKWNWKKHHSVVKNKTGYKFVPARDSSRLVPKMLATKRIDYFK